MARGHACWLFSLGWSAKTTYSHGQSLYVGLAAKTTYSNGQSLYVGLAGHDFERQSTHLAFGDVFSTTIGSRSTTTTYRVSSQSTPFASTTATVLYT